MPSHAVGHLGCFQFGAIMNKASLKICVCVCVCMQARGRKKPRGRGGEEAGKSHVVANYGACGDSQDLELHAAP